MRSHLNACHQSRYISIYLFVTKVSPKNSTNKYTNYVISICTSQPSMLYDAKECCDLHTWFELLSNRNQGNQALVIL